MKAPYDSSSNESRVRSYLPQISNMLTDFSLLPRCVSNPRAACDLGDLLNPASCLLHGVSNMWDNFLSS